MKFGLNFIPSFRASDRTTPEYFETSLRLAERADALGFHSVKMTEHYLFDWAGQCPNPCLFLAGVAARTKRVRLATGALLPAFNHPMKMAAELAMLDNLSGGRVDAGFARAFLPSEFSLFGVSMDESRARLEEGVAVVRRLWTEEAVTHEGKFSRFENARMLPRVVQAPHPPIFIAAVATPESFVWAGRQGYNLMAVPGEDLSKMRTLLNHYRTAWVEAGHPGKGGRIQLSVVCYLAETAERARDESRSHFLRYYELMAEAARAWSTVNPASYPGYQAMLASMGNTTLEGAVASNTALVGTSASVLEQVSTLQRELGDIELSMHVNFGGVGLREATRTLELFSRDVGSRFGQVRAAE